MALNIKNADTEALAHRLADETGESLTGAVTTALRERLARLHADDDTATRSRAERLRALSRDAATRWVEPYRSSEHGDVLYDDAGLPQ